MQDELSVAIIQRLDGTETLSGDQATAQTALIAALATDIDTTSGPAIFQGNRDDAVGFPCITFRPNGGTEVANWIDAGVVRNYQFDFEVWTNSTNAQTIPLIGDYLEILLDERRGATGFTMASGKREFYAMAMTAMTPIYDEKINAWAGLVRYQFIAGKA